MSRLTELISQAKAKDPALGLELEREFKVLSARRSFGLNFERHRPESVELPGRPIRKGDKVRILPPRGAIAKGDQRLWKVIGLERKGEARQARLELTGGEEPEQQSASVADLIVVAEFKDYIYPGLVSTGKVERGGEKPFHTVINGENFHVLEALTFTHRGKIDAIYIDPPYNTGARDWKYNNDYVEGDDLYRHSKWLAMMERRLLISRQLLNQDDSILIVTIDEKEYLRLGLLLEQTFPDARIQMVSIAINPAAVARTGAFGRSDEYIYFVYLGDAGPTRLPLGSEWTPGKGRTHTGTARWDLFRRSGSNASRSHSPGCFYPIYVDPNIPAVVSVGDPLEPGVSLAPQRFGCIPVLPIRKNGAEGVWMAGVREFKSRLEQGRIRINVNKGKIVIYYLADGEFQKIQDGLYPVSGKSSDGSLIVGTIEDFTPMAVPGNQWRIPGHDSTQYGSRLLSLFLPDRKFPYPKSLYAVEDTLRFFVSNKPEATILDFFAGSGTTAHAVMRLNRQDGGRRQCISVTNNEVGADEAARLRREKLRAGDSDWEQWGICDHITKPRIRAAITGETSDGEPIKGDYKFTDEFPMADGFEENAEFFTLTYETPVAVSHNRAFARIAPLLWMRAGSEGRRIDALPDVGWEVADTYGLLTELDAAAPFAETISKAHGIRIAYIVTDDERRFQAIVRQLPETVEPVRLYESYLTNFRFAMGR
ncbi:MAG: site-specific DNA-methyltransferase [Rhodobacter sp.]|nr:site-specific DNA-methyltransferase [Rhodobacter sp.]